MKMYSFEIGVPDNNTPLSEACTVKTDPASMTSCKVNYVCRSEADN